MADKARAALNHCTHCVLFAAGVVHNPDCHRDDDCDADDGDDGDDTKNKAFTFLNSPHDRSGCNDGQQCEKEDDQAFEKVHRDAFF